METFRNLLLRIEKVIEKRTIDHPKHEKMRDYQKGKYNPKFCIVIRDGELLCVWVGNRRSKAIPNKGIVVEDPIATYTEKQCKEGFEPDEWDSLGLAVTSHLEAAGRALERKGLKA